MVYCCRRCWGQWVWRLEEHSKHSYRRRIIEQDQFPWMKKYIGGSWTTTTRPSFERHYLISNDKCHLKCYKRSTMWWTYLLYSSFTRRIYIFIQRSTLRKRLILWWSSIEKLYAFEEYWNGIGWVFPSIPIGPIGEVVGEFLCVISLSAISGLRRKMLVLAVFGFIVSHMNLCK